MMWLLALFGGAFLYGVTRPRHTTIVEQYNDYGCDNGGGDSYYDSGDSYCDDYGGSDDM